MATVKKNLFFIFFVNNSNQMNEKERERENKRFDNFFLAISWRLFFSLI
jgi:hypothetical protein